MNEFSSHNINEDYYLSKETYNELPIDLSVKPSFTSINYKNSCNNKLKNDCGYNKLSKGIVQEAVHFNLSESTSTSFQNNFVKFYNY